MLKGFEKADKSIQRKLILSVEGQEKEGKTHFGLTAPGPIAFFDMDIGTEGVVQKFLDEKEVWTKRYDFKDVMNQDHWVVTWEEFKTDYKATVRARTIGTVIVDTMTEAWELARLARFGRIEQVKPHHYGPVNAEFRDLIRNAYDGMTHVILIHKMKGEYVNDKYTGRRVRAGFSDMGFLVQMSVRVWRDEDGFHLRILDSRHDADLVGMELAGPMLNFETLLELVIPS